MDIWQLKKLVISDTYLLPLQSDIVINVQGYTKLAVLNAVLFFY